MHAEHPDHSKPRPPALPILSDSAARLVAMVEPTHDFLLIRRDPHSRQIGVGLGGKAIIAAGTAQDFQPCRSGVVLKTGPAVRGVYEIGTRVAYGNFAMTVLELERETRVGEEPIEIGLMPATEILCTFSPEADEEALPAPLAADGAQWARAPYGLILVERSRLPNQRGSILLPGSITSSIRSLEATVIDIHPAAGAPPNLHLGDLVLLHQSVGRAIPFGIRADRTLHTAQAAQIIAILRGAKAGEVPDSLVDEESPLRHRKPIDQSAIERDVVWDEGDARAPR